MSYDYFYNREAEQYIHYTLPKLFFKVEPLKKISINAKFLYCILLDRAKSSYKKGFIDIDGKVYLHFAQAEITKLLNCGRTKVSEYFNELDSIGLIERRQKLGIGKTDRIYVKNFAKPLDNNDDSKDDAAPNSRFAYFHDMENLRFENYQIPKTLFLDEEISQISNVAKMAYGIMLDRTKLSLSKGWEDSEGRIYILFPQKELQQLLGCSLRTVKAAMKELDDIGLIDRTRQGMNNPDIIYILDYSTDLKYKTRSGKEEAEHQEVQNLNIGGAESEHREVQNLNIGGAKSEHREVQNLNIGGAKSEHIIYNDTEYNDTDFNDTQSFNPSYADGQTDGLQQTQKEMSFSEMLEAIGYDDGNYIPEDEEYFGDSDDYEVNMCTIPYSFQKNPMALRKALEFVFAYNSFSNDETMKILLGTVIKSLMEMLKKDHCMLDKQTVKYYQIIDIINEVMHNSSLIAWFLSFKEEWSRILSERSIARPESYIKSCVWNSLCNYRFKENNDVLQGDYDCKHDKIYNTKPDNGFDVNKYEIFENSYCTCNDDFNIENVKPTAREKQPESTYNQEIQKHTDEPSIDVTEFLARLRGEKDDDKQKKTEEQKTKLKNALFYKQMYDEIGKPLPKHITETLAEFEPEYITEVLAEIA